MSHTLYREYRPESFDDVVAQDHVIDVLKQAIAKKNLAHAYLFSGSRGVGKTTIARIFAKEIGCNDHDIHEMDAASNRGIDEIRELREGVHSMPFNSPYKAYIIDEVHMLTKDAFNALLKTLEEPPAHVIFILATTEKDKLPETIISRCQVYDFHKPTTSVLAGVVRKVSKEEGVKLEEGVDDLIALCGNYSYRDTLGQLQKVITAAGGKNVSLEIAQKVLKVPAFTHVVSYAEGLLAKDHVKIVEVIRTLSDTAADPHLFFERVIHFVRAASILSISSAERKHIVEELGEAATASAEKLAKDFKPTPKTVLSLLQHLELIQRSALPYVVLEQIGLAS